MLGETAAIASSITWAFANLALARIPARHSPLSIATLKALLATALCALTLLALEHTLWPNLDAPALRVLALSSLLGITIGDLFYLYALAELGARRTIFFSTLVPPASAIAAYFVFGESLTAMQVAGILLTLFGLLLVLYQGRAGDIPKQKLMKGILFGLIVVVLQVAANILTKAGAGTSSALAISTVRLLFGSTGLLLGAALRGRVREVFRPLDSRKDAALIFVAAVFASYLGMWFYMAAIMYTEIGIAVTLSSTSPIFITGLAHFFLGDRATVRAFAGAAICVAGVALLFAGASS